MKWARAAVFLVSAVPVLVLVGCFGDPAQEVSLEPPAGVTAVRHSETGISYLRWAPPPYEVSDYDIEWRFADVPYWMPLKGLAVSVQPEGSSPSVEARGNSLTRGYGARYCYRVRAHAGSKQVSTWSKEACAVHGNYWWTVPVGNPPGYILDLSVRDTGSGVELKWDLETVNSATGDNTSGVEVWRRPVDSAVYETVATLPPEPRSSQDMQFVDEDAAAGEYCYRLAVVSQRGGHRLLDEVCPGKASS
jgi:hypothetical protein